MKVEYQRHKKRTERAKQFWQLVVEKYKSGKSAQQIASEHMNPLTGKNYTRQHMYYILKKAK